MAGAEGWGVTFTRQSILTSSRLALLVKRYHTWPVLREQSVGEHTCQIFRIWWLTWGPPRPEVTTAILWHDAGEIGGGDVPFPAKRNDPLLKSAHDAVEDKAVLAMTGSELVFDQCAELTDSERIRIKICDLLEMHEYGKQEMMMGNRMAEPIVLDTFEAIRELERGLNPAELVRLRFYQNTGRSAT